MDNNKKRGSNFTLEERNLLLKLANKWKNVIENKRTDGTTWKSKEEAWKQIERSFNSCTSGPLRTFKQLKMKYEGIKKDIKKCAANKSYLRGTGGGQHIPPPQPPNEEEKELFETISFAVHGMKSLFDSDIIQDEPLVSEELVVSDSLDEEIIETDWSDFNCRMLQTPLHPAVNVKTDENNVIHVESDHSYSHPSCSAPEIKENVPLSVQDNNKKDWSSRRRPVFKKKCQKPVAAKFEDLATKKRTHKFAAGKFRAGKGGASDENEHSQTPRRMRRNQKKYVRIRI